MATRHLLVIASAGLLTSCGDRPRMWSHSEIEDISDDVAAEYDDTARIEELETRIADLEQKLGMQSDIASAIAEQVSANARIANENVLKTATANGECGTELVQTAPGLWQNRRIPCTEKNYFKR